MSESIWNKAQLLFLFLYIIVLSGVPQSMYSHYYCLLYFLKYILLKVLDKYKIIYSNPYIILYIYLYSLKVHVNYINFNI